MKLSIVIPLFDEVNTIAEIIDRILAVDYGFEEREIVVVDDCSADGSWEIVKDKAALLKEIRAVRLEKHTGKGAALRKGFSLAEGEVIVVQDADLEYDPRDIPGLVSLVKEGKADVVYGSRFIGGGPHRVLFFWHSLGNRFLTLVSNMLTDLNLTDIEVCYKAFRREALEKITLVENGFGFEAEFTIKVSRNNWRIYEVPISYHGRSYAEGKKVNWKDGLKALYCLFKYRFLSDR